MPWRLASVEEQKEYERQRIEEAKRDRRWDHLDNADMTGATFKNDLAVVHHPLLDIDIAALLEGKDLRAVAAENGFWKDSYSTLGPGQLRMTIGNVLRGRLKKKLPVVINGEKIGTGS